MTIGVEIEAEVQETGLLLVLGDIRDWEGKFDGTLGKRGKEYASPIMKDNEKDVSEIYRINEILRRFGMEITKRCGGHVHIGADYITEEEGFRELLELWGNAEEVYYLISNDVGELPREKVTEYAPPISKIIENTGEVQQDKFIEEAKKILDYDRYMSLNIMNINNVKNTIEFRLSNGTLNGDVWIENIRLYGRTVQIAEELGKIAIKMKENKELTEEEKTKYALKEILKENIPLDGKMEILMHLLFSKEERKVYQERYRINKKLDIKEHVIKDMQFGKIDFNGKKEDEMQER